MTVILIVLWVAQSVLAFGVTYGFFQGKWPELAWSGRRTDAGFAALLSAFPISLPIVFLLSGFAEQGLRYRCISKEASWQAHHGRWPSLSRKEFER